MLQIPLGKGIFTPKPYTKGAEYTPLDVVSYNNAVWCCVAQTTTTPSATASAWQLMLTGVPETDIKLPLKNATTFYFRNNGSVANAGLTEAQAWPATQAGINKLQAYDAVDNGVILDFAGVSVAEDVALHNLTSANSVTVNGGTFLALSLPYSLNSVTLQDITANNIYDSATNTNYTGHCLIKGEAPYHIDKAKGRSFVAGVLKLAGKANAAVYLRTFQAGFTVVGELAFDNPVYATAAIYGAYGAVATAGSTAKYTGQFTGKKYIFTNGAMHNYSGAAVHFDNLPGTLPGSFSPTTATIAAMPAETFTAPGDIVGCLRNSKSGYLLCQGGTVSRTTYADLFAVVGTIFGAGDGSTTFHLPDLRERVLQGRWVDTPAGTFRNAGLPNITGSFTLGTQVWDATGAMSMAGGTGEDGGGQMPNNKVAFDASNSSAIYGKSDTVQPPAMGVNWFIKY